MSYKRTPEEGKILALVGSMPYGAMVHKKWPDGPISLDHVALYFSELRDVLREISKAPPRRTRATAPA